MLPQPELHQKLEAYIRRYYLNELLRGGLFALGLGISAFLLFTFSEYLGRFERPLRAAMFFTLLFGNLALLGYYVLRPLLALYRLRGRMSHAQAALNIGAHFEGVGDRLINALQLQEMQQQKEKVMQTEMETLQMRVVKLQMTLQRHLLEQGIKLLKIKLH
jgi:sensor histidine kinase YesM